MLTTFRPALLRVKGKTCACCCAVIDVKPSKYSSLKALRRAIVLPTSRSPGVCIVSEMSSAGKKDEPAESAPLLPRESSGAPNPGMPQMTSEQAAAWMAHNSYYYGDPNTAYAGGAPPPYYWQGYPPPPGQGYPVHQQQQPAQGQPNIYNPQAFAYSPPYNQGQPGMSYPVQQQRPPRSQRPSSGSKPLSSPTNTIEKAFSRDASEERDRSEIPDLGDIFSDTQPLLQQSGNVDGYGATSPPPAVYNAPPRATARSSVSNKTPRGIPRTNSAGDFKHPLKSGSSSRKNHRRINSDGPLRSAHRREASEELPPIVGGPSHRRQGSRSRSFSAGNVKRPTHRRGDSMTSIRSNMSMGSVVSNISKSEFFGGVDEKGRVQMHFPFEAVRLVMIDVEQPSLRRGHLYFDGRMDDFDNFEEYHRLTEGANDGIMAPQWESLDKPNHSQLCSCRCNNCNGCLGKKNLLPTAGYLMAVDDNIYKRILAEISEARTMPCGLYFCGHHDDVAHPSITIAVVIVTILFASLIYLAVFTGDLQL